MGLRIRLRPHERIVVNGCVLTNGDRRNTVTVSSFGQILRGKYILQEEEATTPIRRLYLAIQSALIAGGVTASSMVTLNKCGAAAFVDVTSDEERAGLLTAMDWVHQEDLYKALMELRPLISSVETSGEPAGEETKIRNTA